MSSSWYFNKFYGSKKSYTQNNSKILYYLIAKIGTLGENKYVFSAANNKNKNLNTKNYVLILITKTSLITYLKCLFT